MSATPPQRVAFPPTWPAVIFGAALIGLGVLVIVTQEALAPYIIGLILVFLMNGVVDRLARAGLPRWAGTLITLLALVAAFVLFVYVILDALITQVVSLARSFPEIVATLDAWLADLGLPTDMYNAVSDWLDHLPETVGNFAPQLFGVVLSGVGGIVAFFVAVVGLPFWIFYALSDSPGVMAGLRKAVPRAYRASTFAMIGILGDVFGAWARGQVILSLSVGVPYFILFTIFGLVIEPQIGQYALLFAVILGLAEFVPIVGPVIAVIPVLLITLVTAGIPGGLAVGITFVVVEQIEGAVLIPRVQGSALNLHPVVILPALVVGSALAGLMGAILALPVTAAIRQIFAYLLKITGGADEDDGAERPGLEGESLAQGPA